MMENTYSKPYINCINITLKSKLNIDLTLATKPF